MKPNFYNLYHNQFAVGISADYLIQEIEEYYGRRGEWPLTLACWLLRARIIRTKIIIRLLNILPENWLLVPPAMPADAGNDDEIPF